MRMSQYRIFLLHYISFIINNYYNNIYLGHLNNTFEQTLEKMTVQGRHDTVQKEYLISTDCNQKRIMINWPARNKSQYTILHTIYLIGATYRKHNWFKSSHATVTSGRETASLRTLKPGMLIHYNAGVNKVIGSIYITGL